MSRIMFRTSQISFIREIFNSNNSAFNKENDSWEEFEKEVVRLVCNFIKKETLARAFSWEFREISKYVFFTEHLWATASEMP